MPAIWMTDAFLWTGGLALTSTIVLVYMLGFMIRNRRDRERFTEAVRLGIEKPAAQFPFIDTSRCIGCGTCVKACPEGDVLGIVGGTAVVINGLRCVGHAHCETACPVDAIRVGLGPIRDREDVPILDECYESTVPGVFVVGELGGLSLISNAVAQGKEAVQHIAELVGSSSSGQGSRTVRSPTRRARSRSEHRPQSPGRRDDDASNTVDVGIVGSGPAGIAAAMAAVEAGLSHVVFEQEPDLGGTLLHYPRRKLVLTQAVDLPLGERIRREEYSKEELLALFDGMVKRHHLNVRFNQRVGDIDRLDPEEGGFLIHTASGTQASGTQACHFLVLALGRRGTPRQLGVPGEDLPKVMYQLRDAESYRKRRILCVGGGDSAIEAAIGLARQPGNEVTLSYRREKFVRIKKKNQDAVEKMLRRRKLHAAFGSRVLEIRSDSVVLAIDEERVVLGNDDVFVFIGGEPSWPLLRKLDLGFGGAGPST